MQQPATAHPRLLAARSEQAAIFTMTSRRMDTKRCQLMCRQRVANSRLSPMIILVCDW